MCQGKELGSSINNFYKQKTGEPLRDKNIMDKIIAEVKKNGSDVWLSSDVSKILDNNENMSEYEVVRDILDVCLTFNAFVLENKLKWPADLYLEGTDQHRIFQSSLLAACGTRGTPHIKKF